MSINLKEAVGRMDAGDISVLVNDKELQGFVTDIEKAGRDILTPLSEDEQVGAITLLQAVVVAELLGDGEIQMAMICMKNRDAFGAMMAVALRTVVGLSVQEEWR